MNASIRNRVSVLTSLSSVAICLLFLLVLNESAIDRRNIPLEGNLSIVRINTQKDAYGALRDRGVWGAHLVHFGRHFHLMPYIPQGEVNPVPFPIAVGDIRPEYEKKLDSHNWLFIANKAGLVRKVTTVLPDADFREKTGALDADVSFRPRATGYRGYSFDMSREVFPFSSFDCGETPVAVNVDASFFVGGIRPAMLDSALRHRCKDVWIVLLVDSMDEETVTGAMRDELNRFEELLRARSG